MNIHLLKDRSRIYLKFVFNYDITVKPSLYRRILAELFSAEQRLMLRGTWKSFRCYIGYHFVTVFIISDVLLYTQCRYRESILTRTEIDVFVEKILIFDKSINYRKASV